MGQITELNNNFCYTQFMVPSISFITSNSGKAAEAQSILHTPIELTKIELDEIQSLDLEEIIKKKAQSAFEVVNKPLLVDDVGLFIDTWQGFPGPFIKFLLKAGGNNLLLRMLAPESNRIATARCAVGYHDGEKIHIFMGEVPGEIVREPRGTEGWGWDPIFQPDGMTQTFAEMGESKKNKISHRGRAFTQLKKFLNDHHI